MKSFLSYAIAFLFIFIALSSQVHGFENESILDTSQILIAKNTQRDFAVLKPIIILRD